MRTKRDGPHAPQRTGRRLPLLPEPDLVPIILTQAYIEEIRRELPELPLQRERRYAKELGIAPHLAFVLTYDKPTADFFEEALKLCPNARALCNWIVVEFAGRLKDSGKSIVTSGITAAHLASLVNMIDKGTITGRIAKDVADEMVATPGKSPDEIVAGNADYAAVHDTGEIEALVDKVLAENPQSITDFNTGRDKAFAFLVGQVMKLSRGKASPQIVNELLKSKIAAAKG